MNVRIDGARSDDLALTRDHFSGCAHHQKWIHAVLRIGISSLADFHNTAVANADVRLDDAPVIHDQSVRDHQIESALVALPKSSGTLAHAIADDFTSAESDLVAVDGEILFHFDDKFGVGQANTVAGGGAVEVGVCAARNSSAHFRGPRTRPLWP